MKTLIKVCGPLAAIIAVGLLVQPAFAADEKTITLTGEFVWAADKTQAKTPVKAVLTPGANQEYTAVYTFDWKGKPHTYNGSIKGVLKAGEISGTGNDEKNQRHFTFKGTAANGAITAKCFEIKGDKEMPQGTVEFKN